jgi:hypothetical protein
MKRLFLISMLACVVMIYTGCKKDGVVPAKTTVLQNAKAAERGSSDTTGISGGQHDPGR